MRFRNVALFLGLVALPLAADTNDWTSRYRHRPTDKPPLAELLLPKFGHSRSIIDLSGPWQARRTGEDTWRQVQVPGAYDFEGAVEFRRTFVVDSSLADRAFQLVAYGINNRCTIFLNNEFIGGHRGGHTSFTLSLERRKLRIGEPNTLRIVVNNRLSPTRSLPLKHRPRLLRNYGGIFRELFLMASPPTYLGRVRLNPRLEQGNQVGRVRVEAAVVREPLPAQPDTQEVSLRFECLDPTTGRTVAQVDTQVVAVNNKEQPVQTELLVSPPRLWTPEQPFLYTVRVTARNNREVLEERTWQVGFRRLSVEHGTFQLNGRPFEIKGIDWYEDVGEFGPVVSWPSLRQELERVKALGANTLRVVGTPPHPFLLELCDRLGLFVFEELPLTAVPNGILAQAKFRDLTLRYFEELAERDGYHAALAAWGLGSDLQTTRDETRGLLSQLGRRAERFGDQLTYLVWRHARPRPMNDLADFSLVEQFDRMPRGGPVTPAGSTAPLLLSVGVRLPQEKEHVVTPETTPETPAATPLLPEEIERKEAQAHALQQRLKTARDSVGVFVYTFADWTAARPQFVNGETRTLAVASGLYDRSRNKRLALEVVAAAFQGLRAPRLQERMVQTVNPIVFPLAGIFVVLFFLFNFNRSRRLRGNLRRIFKYPHGFYMELREKRKVPAAHTLFLSLVECAVVALVVASLAFYVRNDSVFNDFADLLISEALKFELAALIWRPAAFVPVVFVATYLVLVALVVLLRLIALFLDEHLPLGQFYTLVFWVFANLIWMLPVVPIYYRLLNRPGWALPAAFCFGLFLLWGMVRLFRGLKVVYNLAMPRMLLLVSVLTLLFGGGIVWYLNRQSAFFEYLPLYWGFVWGG